MHARQALNQLLLEIADRTLVPEETLHHNHRLVFSGPVGDGNLFFHFADAPEFQLLLPGAVSDGDKHFILGPHVRLNWVWDPSIKRAIIVGTHAGRLLTIEVDPEGDQFHARIFNVNTDS